MEFSRADEGRNITSGTTGGSERAAASADSRRRSTVRTGMTGGTGTGGRVTLNDVARAAAVSKSTASYVLNRTPGFAVSDTTRHRIFAAAERLGYRRNSLAAALSSGRIHVVGVTLPVADPRLIPASYRVFIHEFAFALVEAAAAAGLRTTLMPMTRHGANGSDSPGESAFDIADARVDGIILVTLDDANFVRAVYDTGMPCVEIASEFGPYTLRADNEGGMSAAIGHLSSLGHRRIAHVRGGRIRATAVRRAAGYTAAMQTHGLEPHIIEEGELTDVLSLPDGQRPTAISAFNDAGAAVVLRRARSLGLRVPEDLSLVGFDDNVLAEMSYPPLTSLHYPLTELSQASIAVLESLWRGEEPVLPPPMPVSLVVRESTGICRESE
jgi:LacI family transcriptional regulator